MFLGIEFSVISQKESTATLLRRLPNCLEKLHVAVTAD